MRFDPVRGDSGPEYPSAFLTEMWITVSLILMRVQVSLSALLGVLLCAVTAPGIRAQSAATFGDVIALGSIPSDIVLDEGRQRLYLVNTAANTVDVYDYAAKSLLGSVGVGLRPLGAALSPRHDYLYVANHDSSSLTVVALGSFGFGSVASTVSLPARPQGVETTLDGRVLICTDGTGTSSLSNTLLVYDPSGSGGLEAVVFPPPPPTPPSLAPIVARPATTINGRLKRTPDGAYIVGVSSITNNTSTVVYVYESVSSTVLRSRIAVGQSSTLSVAPDSASFMAGFTHYDIATLNVIGQQNTANAPFVMSSSFAANNNVGGSAYSPDGKTLYSAFNTAALTTPPPKPQASTLLISDANSLGIRLGINLPESIVGQIVVTSDGAQAWCLSLSGLTHLPLANLYDYPILMPESTTVFLAQDDCHPGIVQVPLKISNAGGGTLTFAVPQTIPGGAAALVVSTTSGLAPSTVTFTMDPGRSGVVRVPGTNLYSGGGASNSGTVVNLQLVSPNAINVPPAIRIFMNYRDSSMRGIIYPVPTVPNSTVAANQGLQDIVLDEPRHLLYISNPGYNRIEVFDTQKLEFQSPIPVGQLPHQMAMGLDGYTLYVATTGSETVELVDLDARRVVDRIVFPPLPMNANTAITSVSAMAAGLSGLQMLTSNGNLWTVLGTSATPRQGSYITGVTSAGAQVAIAGPTRSMLAADDGSSILLLGGGGMAYRYDALSDQYVNGRQLFFTPIIGYYGPLGVAKNLGFMLANGLVVNNSLTTIGGAASPGQVTTAPPTVPGQPPANAIQSPLRNVAAVAPVDQNLFLRLTTPVRGSVTATITDDVHTTLEAVDTRTGATAVAARMPENPPFSLFGTTRTPAPARQMVVDSSGVVYALTISGLSVAPLTPANSSTQPMIKAGGVVNANTGRASFAPGSFISISGTSLASVATAATLPPPDVLGGSCALIDGVAIPLIATSPTQISAQIPASVRSGVNVLQIRSLATAQRSAPMSITVQRP